MAKPPLNGVAETGYGLLPPYRDIKKLFFYRTLYDQKPSKRAFTPVSATPTEFASQIGQFPCLGDAGNALRALVNFLDDPSQNY